MRVFLDLIESVANGVRVIVGLIVLLIMGSALIFTFGVSYVANGAVEELAASAEEAIKVQREVEMNRSYAQEGWGYQSDSDVPVDDPAIYDDYSASGSAVDEWSSDDWNGES